MKNNILQRLTGLRVRSVCSDKSLLDQRHIRTSVECQAHFRLARRADVAMGVSLVDVTTQIVKDEERTIFVSTERLGDVFSTTVRDQNGWSRYKPATCKLASETMCKRNGSPEDQASHPTFEGVRRHKGEGAPICLRQQRRRFPRRRCAAKS
jgi:hypothetical protein